MCETVHSEHLDHRNWVVEGKVRCEGWSFGVCVCQTRRWSIPLKGVLADGSGLWFQCPSLASSHIYWD